MGEGKKIEYIKVFVDGRTIYISKSQEKAFREILNRFAIPYDMKFNIVCELKNKRFSTKGPLSVNG